MSNTHYSAKCGAQPLFAPVEEAELLRFEATLIRKLPDEYRAFLLEWNGVRFKGEFVAYPIQPLQDHSPDVPTWDKWVPSAQRTIHDNIDTAATLYGLGSNHRDSLWVTRSTAELNMWYPKRFLAIGNSVEDMEIGQLLISLDEPDRGHVFSFAFPVDPPELGVNYPSMDFMWWTAPSFEHFWSSLRGMSEEEYREWR